MSENGMQLVESTQRYIRNIPPSKLGEFSKYEYVVVESYKDINGGQSYTKLTVNENGKTKDIQISDLAMKEICSIWFRNNGHA